MLGEAAFQAEYQQNPVELSTALNITPSIVNARVGSYNQLELPNENVLFVCASTDLNPSKFFTTVVCAFMRDSTCRVIWHKFTPTKISQTLTEQEYYKAIYDALTRLGVELKKVSNSLPRPIQGWAVDCNGMNWNAAMWAILLWLRGTRFDAVQDEDEFEVEGSCRKDATMRGRRRAQATWDWKEVELLGL